MNNSAYDTRKKTLEDLSPYFAKLISDISLCGYLKIPGDFATEIWAQDLEHMAEILVDILPNEDPQRCFPVDVEGIGRIFFTCTGTYFELPS